MKVWRLIFAVAILCCSAAAFADGTVFVQMQGIAKPRIPDQSALITFDGKTERLVIETAVEGEGTEFAWVVPVPSLPKVEAATTGVFPTLRMVTRPRVVGYETDWPLAPVLGLVFGLLIWLAICTRRLTTALAIFLIALFLLGFLMPAFATARVEGVNSGPWMSNGVNVLERKIVGLYETATISGADGKKIAEWLNNNGFRVPASVQDALTQYAKEGWIFVAARIRRDSAETGRFSPHPLSFTFAASRAVYPLRLTGIENGPVAVDLYVVGNEEAVAAPFKRQRTGRLDFDAQGDQDDSIPVAHEALQSYCKGLSAMTLMTATLRPEQMKADVYLTWKPLTPFRHVYYMRNAALARASQFAAATFVLLSIVCAILYRRWKCLIAAAVVLLFFVCIIGGMILMGSSDKFPYGFPIGFLIMLLSFVMLIEAFYRAAKYDRQRRDPPLALPFIKVVMIAVLAPILLGSCVYLVLPKLPDAQVLKMHGLRFRYLFKEDHKEILEKLNELQPGGDTAPNLVAYKKEAASIIAGWREKYGEDYYRNPFSGLPYREEDSPGNYVIELKGDKPTYFYFDINGRKIELGVIGRKSE
jgi:hypothetical protein